MERMKEALERVQKLELEIETLKEEAATAAQVGFELVPILLK